MIYLDHAATTPMAPEVMEAMLPYLSERFGNPSSIHSAGREARAAMDAARDTTARSLSCGFEEIYFTSGGTESDNLAVFGTLRAAPAPRRRLIVSAIEHHAVLHSARRLETEGFEVLRLPVEREGFVDPDDLRSAVDDTTALVSILHGSNEIGTIQDVPRLARIAHEAGACFHTDAVQTFGALPLHVRGMGVDLLSISAHKIYGPKAVGALYIRSGLKTAPMMYGGAQEREKRAGTENVPGVVGLARAIELMTDVGEAERERLTGLRDEFIARLEDDIEGLLLNGPRAHRLANNVNVTIEGVDGASALMSLDREGIAASSGSACSSGAIEPSHVLAAIGLPPHLAAGGLRFTLGRGTTRQELEETVTALAGIARRLRRSGVAEPGN